ncbi:hypothetical protein QWY85_05260 [Neolewinella lacunae]|uniref:Uncharacterized protein n=1 Tax=Neolewinella lacunae TaxID=1517758 RepID=A0A923PJ60_9BACT|nr:hypothetical protein [Neolewinella lacunae]MBC6995108.1 hypothetical protein [Neolewinella lacunae]MDN3634058.1 hypothetical protein [Neolewinella lacunae]
MPEVPGKKEDLTFLAQEADWLRNSIVTHRIDEKSGRFWVVMLYTDPADALRKLVRPITDYPTRERAEWHANLLQRQISADPRDPRPKNSSDADDLFSN